VRPSSKRATRNRLIASTLNRRYGNANSGSRETVRLHPRHPDHRRRQTGTRQAPAYSPVPRLLKLRKTTCYEGRIEESRPVTRKTTESYGKNVNRAQFKVERSLPNTFPVRLTIAIDSLIWFWTAMHRAMKSPLSAGSAGITAEGDARSPLPSLEPRLTDLLFAASLGNPPQKRAPLQLLHLQIFPASTFADLFCAHLG
jgi:hypothetical protein